MTYAELNTLSSRLANYLASRGVGPEVTVPVCFEKSRWAIVSLLAVLRAGGTFVLFDISQPVARLKSIIMQTNAKLALRIALPAVRKMLHILSSHLEPQVNQRASLLSIHSYLQAPNNRDRRWALGSIHECSNLLHTHLTPVFSRS